VKGRAPLPLRPIGAASGELPMFGWMFGPLGWAWSRFVLAQNIHARFGLLAELVDDAVLAVRERVD
jgi:hypothetical protein